MALDTYSLEVAGANAVQQEGSPALIYGIASSDKAYYYLDRNIVKALIVPDEWEEGYQAMSRTVQLLHHTSASLSDATAGYTVVRRDNLFSEENQDRLFTGSK